MNRKKISFICLSVSAVFTLLVLLFSANWENFSAGTIACLLWNILPYAIFLLILIFESECSVIHDLCFCIASIVVFIFSSLVLIDFMFSASSTSALIFIFWPACIFVGFPVLMLLAWPVVKMTGIK